MAAQRLPARWVAACKAERGRARCRDGGGDRRRRFIAGKLIESGQVTSTRRTAIGTQTATVAGPDGTPAGDVIVAFVVATWSATWSRKASR
jgi:hypothetical protein